MSLGAVFPGQGAQSVGMLAELAEVYPSVIERFSKASDVLGFDTGKMVQAGPAEDQCNAEHSASPADCQCGRLGSVAYPGRGACLCSGS